MAFAALYLNRRMLPAALAPSTVTAILTLGTGLFFAFFAGYYIYAELLT
ncbi:hypothetical protein [Methanoculleus frigidifontis]|nr:hypothetical protein [Methanoculleus sp. FWC-SCC1]